MMLPVSQFPVGQEMLIHTVMHRPAAALSAYLLEIEGKASWE